MQRKKFVIEELRYKQIEEKSCKNTQLAFFRIKTNRSLIFFCILEFLNLFRKISISFRPSS